MVVFVRVECRVWYPFSWCKCYHFWGPGCYHFLWCTMVLGCYHLCYHLALSFILCYHLMLSFFDVIIWCYHFSQFANVIIFVLSFFLVQDGCYHLCYHLMLSFLLSFPPFFLFPEKWHTPTNLLIYKFSNQTKARAGDQIGAIGVGINSKKYI